MVEDTITVGQSLINTVVGMGTVFLELIIISLIIASLKFIPMLLNKIKCLSKKEVTAPVVAVKEETSPSEEIKDDEALIAVITAAIYEYENANGNAVSGDLVVRSIRRHNSGWKRA